MRIAGIRRDGNEKINMTNLTTDDVNKIIFHQWVKTMFQELQWDGPIDLVAGDKLIAKMCRPKPIKRGKLERGTK